MTDTSRPISPAESLLAIAALAAGMAIAWVDTRPHWDDTAVTAGLMFLSAALASLAGVRPWLATVLVAAPLVAAEISSGFGILIVALIPLVASYAGWAVRGRIRKAG